MLIRTAVPADAAALAEVEALCFPAAEAAPEQQFRDRLQAYAGHFWLMFDGETLISFVDGMVTDQPDLTDDLYENAALHSETGAWQMIFWRGDPARVPQTRSGSPAAEPRHCRCPPAGPQGSGTDL